ncbi:hypothetical protein QCD60_30240 [Pokkaliibacter sp. MBI-7]|uniref:hypothetical protein n=1 Tax=Pokkaliibacter sp. MBI-7 TaxID=3040600 RepID=UPI002447568A|nr:hypothetical protein [Pokkaliibacter sp. MBI-7]MDH2431001.1 hypothetical protein [Pokkaliibacter sp. MBI-7]MDH2434809.1 hypothetical protein [Pokkaliibacter sp. MBI-7]MDH2436639.1 hypothetical protein [Pokkaliibacter sp. MBI-7]MDH2436796.1 hypothetical protein [Pokkaliibacter sp. MBI-7]
MTDKNSRGSILDDLDQFFGTLGVLIACVIICWVFIIPGWHSRVDAGRVQLHEVSEQLEHHPLVKQLRDASVVRIESESSGFEPGTTTATVTLRDGAERVIEFQAFALFDVFPGESITSRTGSAFVARCIAQHLVIDLQEKTPVVTVTKDCGHYENRDTVPPAAMMSIAKVAVDQVLNKILLGLPLVEAHTQVSQ